MRRQITKPHAPPTPAAEEERSGAHPGYQQRALLFEEALWVMHLVRYLHPGGVQDAHALSSTTLATGAGSRARPLRGAEATWYMHSYSSELPRLSRAVGSADMSANSLASCLGPAGSGTCEEAPTPRDYPSNSVDCRGATHHGA
jgi:hypothetical protein